MLQFQSMLCEGLRTYPDNTMQRLIGNPYFNSKYELRWYLAYFQNSIHLQLTVNKNTNAYSKNDGLEVKSEGFSLRELFDIGFIF